MAKFLDENGVKKLWSRIQEYVYECCCSKGGGDVGYECQEAYETLWNGNVVTEYPEGELVTYAAGVIPYTSLITADKLRVTFDGVIYECDKIMSRNGNLYGGIGTDGNVNWGKYPFAIGSSSNQNRLLTKYDGAHTLIIEADNSTVTTTECFQKAVKSASDSGYECSTSFEEAFSESGTTTKDEDASYCALDYKGLIDAGEIKVVLNDKEYICQKMIIDNGIGYGGVESFADYPFMLASSSHGNVLVTKDPMDFDITVFHSVATAKVTDCFKAAVNTAVDIDVPIVVAHVSEESTGNYTLQEDILDLFNAVNHGKYAVARLNGEWYGLEKEVVGKFQVREALVFNNTGVSDGKDVTERVLTIHRTNGISLNTNVYPRSVR